MNPAISLPEPGQLVDVRRRRYVVVDVTQDPLASARDALKAGGWQPQHLVTLSSVEDDALGRGQRALAPPAGLRAQAEGAIAYARMV